MSGRHDRHYISAFILRCLPDDTERAYGLLYGTGRATHLAYGVGVVIGFWQSFAGAQMAKHEIELEVQGIRNLQLVVVHEFFDREQKLQAQFYVL